MGTPLHGLRVVDLSVWRPGPYATRLLLDRGADVVKVEPPGGDPMRVYPELFESLNAGKRSMRVDLKTEAGREEVLEMTAAADVVVEGFRPGVVDRLGVGPAAVTARNPAVVYCSISGFGQTGPLAAVPGHDLTYMAWAGALSPDGASPVVPRIPVADLAAGMAAAFEITAACMARTRTGDGAVLDIAMADVLATWTGRAEARLAGRDAPSQGVPGYGTFATADGAWIALGVLDENPFWRALTQVLELDDVAGLAFVDRANRARELQVRVAEAIAGWGRDDLVERLLAAGVPCGPVLDRAGMLANEHFRFRDVP